MDKRVTIILDACGVVVGIAGIAVFFVQEKYLAVAAVLGIVVFLVLWSIHQVRRAAMTFVDFHTYAEFPHKNTRECLLRLEKTVIARTSNITTIFNRNIGGPGKIDFLGTNIGEMGPPINEGNLYSVPTILRSPLPIGEPVEHILRVRSWDCFPDDRETLVCFVTEPFKKEVGLHVIVPDSKPCRAAKLYIYNKSGAHEMDLRPTITDRGTKVDVVVPSPVFGAKYVLEWEW
ncbi:MAG: hypothetical protein JRE64_24200 [Deltaproteobacteria bacterium]|nr:hypothetical protein [Deltaproteobacteria bacterium]